MKPVETLVIVGGGTAGWIAASLIRARFGTGLSITVIESDRISTVGVGEASLPVLRGLLRALRIDEAALIQECDASLKAGLRFVGWRNARPDDVFYHLFFGADESEPLLTLIDRLQMQPGTPEEFWHALLEQGLLNGREFMADCTLAGQLIEGNKASKRTVDGAFQSPLGYGYHVDAKLFADFLCRWSVQRGVRHLTDHVVQVNRDENGDISSLRTEKHGVIAGDFFVDCTGFRGVLINEALAEPFDAYRPWLLCDSAVAFQVPYEDTDAPLPAYTGLDALSAGWLWRIPLFSRLGTGYVYSREFLSRDAAEAEARAHLGPAAAACEANHIRMRVGKNRRTWVNNCLSVGLAAGFLEALESTSLALIQRGVAKFLTCFRDRRFDEQDRDRYNHLMTEDFEECRDFLIIHYCLSEREDTPFWRETRHLQIPPRIEAVLREWRERGSVRDFLEAHGNNRFFPPVSWYSILLGMTDAPRDGHGGRPGADLDAASRWLAQWQASLRQTAGAFPDHRTYLAKLRAEATTPVGA